MYIVVIAWMYVAVMMAFAEATATNGSVLGAAFTFLLYGVLPCGLLIYIMGTPGRKRAIRDRERLSNPPVMEATTSAAAPTVASNAPDGGSHAPADAVATMRKEP